MDLIPRPDQVIAAASNVAQKLLYGGLADLRPMPRTIIDEGNLREVYHYLPAAGVAAEGDPILLVTPLAAPSLCFDLRRGGSLAEYLVDEGRRTYLVEYGAVSFRDRSLGLEHWIDEVLPAAVRAVSEHAGGRPVHLVGWSLGGLFSLLTAAAATDLPIASVTSLGVPADVTQVPLVAPLRPLLNLSGGRGAITSAYRAMGGVPKPLVGWAFQLASVEKVLTKPLAILGNLDNAEFLAQLEAVDRFTESMIAYPGRSFGQVYHRFVKGNELAGGTMTFGDQTISLADIKVPVLVFAGATDGIAPVSSVKAVVPMLTGSPEVRFEIVPGGHLGMLTGRAARETTWPVLVEWVEQTSAAAEASAPAAPARKRAARTSTARQSTAKKAATAKTTTKTTAKKTTAKKSTARAAATKSNAKRRPATKAPAKTATKAPAKDSTKAPATAAATAPAKRTAASREAIGSNPRRRYGSDSSRALGGR